MQGFYWQRWYSSSSMQRSRHRFWFLLNLPNVWLLEFWVFEEKQKTSKKKKKKNRKLDKTTQTKIRISVNQNRYKLNKQGWHSKELFLSLVLQLKKSLCKSKRQNVFFFFYTPKWIMNDMSNQQTKHLLLKNNWVYSTNPFIQFSDVSSAITLIIKELLLD